MIVADTDVLIDALRGDQEAVERVTRGLNLGSLYTTAVTAFELASGAKGYHQAVKIGHLLDALPVLAFDEPSSARAVVLRRRLEGRGRGIGMADYLIAGVCLCRDAALWTRNRKHFGRVSGLRLI